MNSRDQGAENDVAELRLLVDDAAEIFRNDFEGFDIAFRDEGDIRDPAEKKRDIAQELSGPAGPNDLRLASGKLDAVHMAGTDHIEVGIAGACLDKRLSALEGFQGAELFDDEELLIIETEHRVGKTFSQILVRHCVPRCEGSTGWGCTR